MITACKLVCVRGVDGWMNLFGFLFKRNPKCKKVHVHCTRASGAAAVAVTFAKRGIV
jgi:hypothetical protein